MSADLTPTPTETPCVECGDPVGDHTYHLCVECGPLCQDCCFAEALTGGHSCPEVAP